MIIHNIYWDFYDTNYKIEDNKIFKHSHEKTFNFCKDNNITLKLWNKDDCLKLIEEHFKDYVKLWNFFRYDIQRVDFMKYCILYQYGGIYMDCDAYPVRDLCELYNHDYFFTKFVPRNHISNSIMGAKPKNDIWTKIITEIEKSTYEKQNMEIYDIWKARLVFQTTGQRVIKRVNGNKNMFEYSSIINDDKKIYNEISNPYFIDHNVSAWCNSVSSLKNWSQYTRRGY